MRTDKDALESAIRKNNADEISSMIRSILDSNDQNLLQTLIENHLGVEALKYAISLNNFEMTSALIDKGVNVEDNGVMKTATASRNLDIIKKVFNAIASNKDLLIESRNTALTYAIEDMNWALVNFLIEQGVDDINKENTLLLLNAAIQKNDNQILDLLLGKKNLDFNTSNLRHNPLIIAADLGNKYALRTMLFEKGGDPYLAGFIDVTMHYIGRSNRYGIASKIENEDIKQVITDYLALEQDFKENFANKVKDKLTKYKGANSLEEAYKEITVALKDLVQDDDKKFTSAFHKEEIKIQLNFLDKFIIEIKALLGLSNKLDAAQERIFMRIEEKIYAGIRSSELFKELEPSLKKNVSAAKAEQIAAERENTCARKER